MKLVKNISDFKELQPYWNFKGEQMLLHFDANMKNGGVVMRDHDGVVPQAIKDILKKVAGKIATGKLADMSTIAQPAYLHHYITQHHLHKNDVSFACELKAAARTSDVVQRMRHLVKFLVAPNFINPTLCQCRIPMNPILGETTQKEMSDGTKLYMEQICHRPQISAFLVEDPDGDYTMSGSYEIKGWINGVNSVQGSKKSKNIRL